MQPIIFRLAEVRNPRSAKLGVGPSLQGMIPLPVKYWPLSGVTRDSASAPLPSCTVRVYRSLDDVEVDTLVSGADGSFETRVPGPAEQYYCVAHDPTGLLAGVTLRTLEGRA